MFCLPVVSISPWDLCQYIFPASPFFFAQCGEPLSCASHEPPTGASAQTTWTCFLGSISISSYVHSISLWRRISTWCFVPGLSDEDQEKILLRFYGLSKHLSFSHVHPCLSLRTWSFTQPENHNLSSPPARFGLSLLCSPLKSALLWINTPAASTQLSSRNATYFRRVLSNPEWDPARNPDVTERLGA